MLVSFFMFADTLALFTVLPEISSVTDMENASAMGSSKVEFPTLIIFIYRQHQTYCPKNFSIISQ